MKTSRLVRKKAQKRTADSEPKTFSGFISGNHAAARKSFTFLSLFSGAGIGDLGFTLAGGRCVGACEVDENRRAVHIENHGVPVWADIRQESAAIISAFTTSRPDVIVATPPCQSFSTANSGRGMRLDPVHALRDRRNTLFFDALRVINALKPKVAVFENVPNFLERLVTGEQGEVAKPVKQWLSEALSDYHESSTVGCFSILGVPQRRKRAICVFVRKDLAEIDDCAPISDWSRWPGKLIRSPRTVRSALRGVRVLDGRSLETSIDGTDYLHSVPAYNDVHYSWISSIPPFSGGSAWENSCESCGSESCPVGQVQCDQCGASLLNRPHVVDSGGVRPIRGFKTSYRRMLPDEVAPTITTSSGHFSSDIKIHFSENRVLSPRECARLQTIPDSFSWPIAQRYKKNYLVREMIGEAVPPLVFYRLGMAIGKILK